MHQTQMEGRRSTTANAVPGSVALDGKNASRRFNGAKVRQWIPGKFRGVSLNRDSQVWRTLPLLSRLDVDEGSRGISQSRL